MNEVVQTGLWIVGFSSEGKPATARSISGEEVHFCPAMQVTLERAGSSIVDTAMNFRIGVHLERRIRIFSNGFWGFDPC